MVIDNNKNSSHLLRAYFLPVSRALSSNLKGTSRLFNKCQTDAHRDYVKLRIPSVSAGLHHAADPKVMSQSFPLPRSLDLGGSGRLTWSTDLQSQTSLFL